MAINRHLIDDFLHRTEELQERIINRNINDPGDDPESRIMNRYTRDLQLITVRGVAEMAKLEGEDPVQKGIVWVACAMLEGVAAITAALIDGDPATAAHFTEHFIKEMARARKAVESLNKDNDE